MLRQTDADELRQLIADGQFAKLGEVQIDALTLGATLELACLWARPGAEPARSHARNLFDALCRRFLPCRQAREFFRAGGLVSRARPEDHFASPEYELVLVKREILIGSDWPLFLQRFSRTMRQKGFGASFAIAFAAALGEMADNVAQHSTAVADGCDWGLAGFHVNMKQATFTVVDAGRGILASLRENPLWQHLPDHASALDAIIQQEATRKVHNAHGDGFRQVFKSLVDHNGHVRLRSGNASVELESVQMGRTCETRFGPTIPGVSITVTCALRGKPAEFSLPDEKSC